MPLMVHDRRTVTETPSKANGVSAADVVVYLGRATPRCGRTLNNEQHKATAEECHQLPHARPVEANHVILDGPRLAERSEREVTEVVREHVTASVRRSLQSYSQPALLLSGGLDSTILLSVCNELGIRPKCFVAAQPGIPSHDVSCAKRVAAEFGTTCEVVTISSKSFSTALDHLVRLRKGPITSWSAIAQYLITEAAKEAGCDVVMSGIGSDEVFGGYHKIGKYAWRFEDTKQAIGQELAWRTLLGCGSVRRSHLLYIGQSCPYSVQMLQDMFPALFSRSLLEDDVVSLFTSWHNTFPEAEYIALILQLEFELRTQYILLREFRIATESGGLPAAFPYLDTTLVRGVAHLPLQLRYTPQPSPNLKWRPATKHVEKLALRLAFQDRIPGWVQIRRRGTYSLCIQHWWKENTEALTGRILASRLWNETNADISVLRRILSHPLDGNHWNWPYRVWLLLQLSMWREVA